MARLELLKARFLAQTILLEGVTPIEQKIVTAPCIF